MTQLKKVRIYFSAVQLKPILKFTKLGGNIRLVSFYIREAVKKKIVPR